MARFIQRQPGGFDSGITEIANQLNGVLGNAVGLVSEIGRQDLRETTDRINELEEMRRVENRVEQIGFGDELRGLTDQYVKDDRTFDVDGFNNAIADRLLSIDDPINAATFQAEASLARSRAITGLEQELEAEETFEARDLANRLGPRIGEEFGRRFGDLAHEDPLSRVDPIVLRDDLFNQAQGRFRTRSGRRQFYQSLTEHVTSEHNRVAADVRAERGARAFRSAVSDIGDYLTKPFATPEGVVSRVQAVGMVAEQAGIDDNEITGFVRDQVNAAITNAELAEDEDRLDLARAINVGAGDSFAMSETEFTARTGVARRRIRASHRSNFEAAFSDRIENANSFDDFEDAARMLGQNASLYQNKRPQMDALKDRLTNAAGAFERKQRDRLWNQIEDEINKGGGGLLIGQAERLLIDIDAAANGANPYLHGDDVGIFEGHVNAAVVKRTEHEFQVSALATAREQNARTGRHSLDLSTLPDDVIVNEFDRAISLRAEVGEDPETGDPVQMIPPDAFGDVFGEFMLTLGPEKMPDELFDRMEIAQGSSADQVARFVDVLDHLKGDRRGANIIRSRIKNDHTLAALAMHTAGVKGDPIATAIGELDSATLGAIFSEMTGSEDEAGRMPEDLRGYSSLIWQGRFLEKASESIRTASPELTFQAAENHANRIVESETVLFEGRRVPRRLVGPTFDEIDLQPILTQNQGIIAEQMMIGYLQLDPERKRQLGVATHAISQSVPIIEDARVTDDGKIMVPVRLQREEAGFIAGLFKSQARSQALDELVFEIELPRDAKGAAALQRGMRETLSTLDDAFLEALNDSARPAHISPLEWRDQQIIPSRELGASTGP